MVTFLGPCLIGNLLRHSTSESSTLPVIFKFAVFKHGIISKISLFSPQSLYVISTTALNIPQYKFSRTYILPYFLWSILSKILSLGRKIGVGENPCFGIIYAWFHTFVTTHPKSYLQQELVSRHFANVFEILWWPDRDRRRIFRCSSRGEVLSG